MKHLTRTTFAAGGLIAGAGLMLTAIPASSSSSPAVALEAPAASTSAPASPIVIEEAPRLAAAAQVADAAPAAAQVATPAQEAPTAAAVEDPPAQIADAITVTRPAATLTPPASAATEGPQTITTAAPAPAADPSEVVWIRLAGQGYCSQTARGNLAPGVQPDPTCPGDQPGPRYSPPPASTVTVRVADGSCVQTGPGEAAALGQPNGDPTCPAAAK